jgi:hypothetical protein
MKMPRRVQDYYMMHANQVEIDGHIHAYGEFKDTQQREGTSVK